jgi:hypothetical protein
MINSNPYSAKKTAFEVSLALHGTTNETLQTNYPFADTKEKKRKYLMQAVYFVDSRKTGLTVGRFTNLLKAMKFLEKINGVLRPWQPSDDQMDDIQAELRKDKQMAFSGPHRPLTETKRPKPRKIFSKE